MKNIRNIFLILAILHLPVAGWGATTYYVDSTRGNDDNDGTSTETPLKTIARINRVTYSNGDVVALKRGEVWTDAGFSPGNNISNNFTLQDYGEGALPHINANNFQPILITPTAAVSNLVIKNIDVSGQDWVATKDAAIRINNVSRITIDNVYGNGHFGGGHYGKHGIAILGNSSGAIEIKNSTLFNYGPATILSEGEDFMGIVALGITSGTISIHNNTIYNVTADCIQLFESTAPTSIYSNKLYNPGENSIDVKSASNVDIYNNHMYREDNFIGGGGSGGSAIIVIHDTSKHGSGKVIVRNNTIENNDQTAIEIEDIAGVLVYENTITGSGVYKGAGINVDNNTGAKIYRNWIEGISGSIRVGITTGVEVYYNVIVNPLLRTESTHPSGGIYENNSGSTLFFNNTIYNRSGTAEYLFDIAFSGGSIVKNNIIYQGLSGTTHYPLFVGKAGTAPTVTNNLWYSAGVARVSFRGTVYNLANYGDWLARHSGELFSDPLFVSASDYRLQSSSPAVNAGVDAGLTTDYSGTTLPQGSSPDIGAYESISYISPIRPPPHSNILLQ